MTALVDFIALRIDGNRFCMIKYLFLFVGWLSSLCMMYFIGFHMQKQGMVKEGEEVALLQSGRQPIWRFQSTHNIQVRQA
jgi:hypothetical protein